MADPQDRVTDAQHQAQAATPAAQVVDAQTSKEYKSLTEKRVKWVAGQYTGTITAVRVYQVQQIDPETGDPVWVEKHKTVTQAWRVSETDVGNWDAQQLLDAVSVRRVAALTALGQALDAIG